MQAPFILIACTLLLARPTLADVYAEPTGVRSAGMGLSHRAVGTSNDTISMNPAGMALARRYSVQLQYAHSAFDRLRHMSATAVDSKSGPVAGGLAYIRTTGDEEAIDPELQRIYVALAYPLTERIAVGITGRHIRGEFNESIGEDDSSRTELALYGGDVGISANLGGGLGFGFTYHNVVQSERHDFTPQAMAFAMAYNSPTLVLSTDLIRSHHTFEGIGAPAQEVSWSYHLGAEVLAANAFPLRAGWRRESYQQGVDGALKRENIFSIGGAWVVQTGSLEVSYSRSTTRARNWQLIGALQFFL